MNSKRSFKASALIALSLGALARLAGAGALEQIKPISQLPEIDLPKLEQGDIVSARGPLGNFSRGVYAETCFYIHAPVPAVGRKLLHWNSAKHPELEISQFREYNWPAAPNIWDSLSLTSSRREDRWLTERTWQLLSPSAASTDLHVTHADVSTFQEMARQTRNDSRDAVITAFWRKVLRSRNDAIAGGGLGAVPAYSAGDVRIETRAEFNQLLRQAPPIAARFRELVGGAPFTKAGGGSEVDIVPYWEAASARGHTNLHAAFFVARKGTSSWQLADCTYYVSDTYFMSFTLYELFPQDNGTLVWQIDFVSAPFRSFTGGIDRVFAGNEIVKEAAKTARLFRADMEKNQ